MVSSGYEKLFGGGGGMVVRAEEITVRSTHFSYTNVAYL